MDQIKYEDFAKLDLRVAIITDVQPVEGADKLLLLKLDDGTPEGRTILAGIKKQFPGCEESKAALLGERIIIVANLEPRKMRGIESQGMLLAASDDDGDLQLLTTRHYIKAGSKVG